MNYTISAQNSGANFILPGEETVNTGTQRQGNQGPEDLAVLHIVSFIAYKTTSSYMHKGPGVKGHMHKGPGVKGHMHKGPGSIKGHMHNSLETLTLCVQVWLSKTDNN